MGRYIREVRLKQPIDVVSMMMDDYVYHEHFTRTDWNDEMAFYVEDSHKRERYMKWSYLDGLFHMEAWLKNPLGGEMDLDGVVGSDSRKEFRASIDRLIETLQRTDGEAIAGGHIGSDPLHHDSGHVDNHDVWNADTAWQQGGGRQPADRGQSAAAPQNRPAGTQNVEVPRVYTSGGSSGRSVYKSGRDPESTQAMLYAVLALIFGGWIPILGIIFTVAAWRKQEYCSNPTTVKVLCILSVVVMVSSFVIQFLLGFYGIF